METISGPATERINVRSKELKARLLRVLLEEIDRDGSGELGGKLSIAVGAFALADALSTFTVLAVDTVDKRQTFRDYIRNYMISTDEIYDQFPTEVFLKAFGVHQEAAE